MCSPAEIVDALLKLHKNAWKDALRFVVEQSIKDHATLAEFKKANHELMNENAKLRERLTEIEPTPKPWFETIIASADAVPDAESVFPPVCQEDVSAPFPPRMRYGAVAFARPTESADAEK